MTASIQGDPRFPIPPELKIFPEAHLAVISVAIAVEPAHPSALDAVTTIREQYISPALAGVPAEAVVGDVSAEHTDFRAIVRGYTPVVFAFVLGFSLVLLMVVFRSLVIPLKAILVNSSPWERPTACW